MGGHCRSGLDHKYMYAQEDCGCVLESLILAVAAAVTLAHCLIAFLHLIDRHHLQGSDYNPHNSDRHSRHRQLCHHRQHHDAVWVAMLQYDS